MGYSFISPTSIFNPAVMMVQALAVSSSGCCSTHAPGFTTAQLADAYSQRYVPRVLLN